MAEQQRPSTCTLHLQTANEYGVWTGGADSKTMETLKTTSIVGGMRFWTDALLRAEGKACCTDQSRCYAGPGKTVCPTCAVFGCTGLSRAFTVQAETPVFAKREKANPKNRIPLGSRQYMDSKGQVQTPKYFLTYGYTGPVTLKLTMRRPHGGAIALPAEALTGLYLMLEYGTFGAYDQYGCGQVNMDPEERAGLQALCAAYRPQEGPADTDGPTLRDFFFFKGQVSASNLKEAMCEIRYDVRKALRPPLLPSSLDRDLRRWFCGSLGRGDENCGTNYSFSVDPASGKLFGWGHFARAGIRPAYPEHRESVVGILHATVRQKCGSSLVWKEFGSSRDASSPRSWPEYLASLISANWRQQ